MLACSFARDFGAAPVTDWLAKHWVPGALFMAGALLALAPLIYSACGLQLLLIYLHSPGYMLHQVEEHTGDRFRRFLNQRIFGVEALTTVAASWINLPGVWGLNLAALYLAFFVEPGWGLAAPYLMVVNALVHLGTAARTRGHNPGLWTSLALFFPLGAATLWLVPATGAQHVLGLVVAVAVAVHLAITVGVGARAMRARRA